MAKVVDLRFAGLWNAPNDYTAPAGALDRATNTVTDQKDISQSRRGFDIEIDNSDGSQVGFPLKSFIATKPNSTTFDLLTFRYNETSGVGRLRLDDANTISGNTAFGPPAGTLVARMLNWGAYVYVSSNQGLQRYSTALNTSVSAGIPQALDLVLSLTGSSGFFTSNEVGTFSIQVTDASPLLTLVSSVDVQQMFIGQYLTGTGIVAGSTIQNIALSAPVVNYAADLTAGVATIQVPSDVGIVAGQIITGQGLQENTRVVSVSGSGPYDVAVSIAPIETATGQVVTFNSDNIVTMSQNASIMGGPSVESISVSNGSQIAYRLVWGLINENKATMLGAPSGFTTIVNTTGGSRNVVVNASIPAGITTSYFYQLYRSVATPTSQIPPADQMQLVAQGTPTSGDLTAGFIAITDVTPDSLKGQALYTGSDVEGISRANLRPPIARDVGNYRGYLLYANYTRPFELKINIDGVGSPLGVQLGDEITITAGTTSFVVEAAAAEDIAAGEFAVVTTGTPAQNIADTAESFIRVVNRFASNTLIYAQNLSGPGELPGQILLYERPGVGAFTVVASANGTAWTPDIVTAVAAEAERVPNGILVSKPQEPEAVPAIFRFLAGGVGNEILRVVPLRDYTVILTTEGVYRLTGQTVTNFSVEPFDLTVQLVAPETAQALGNECWCLSSQGVVSISDGGVRIRSGLQINNILQALIQGAPNSVRDYAFAVAYESNQRYILSLPNAEGDTVCLTQYCYNYITDAWTDWDRNCTAGYIHPLAGLFLGNGNNQNVVRERKSGSFTDYVDEPIPVLIQSYDGFDVVLDTIAGLTVGDLLWQNQSGIAVYSEILAIDTPNVSVTVANEIAWDIGGLPADTEVLTAINNVIQWKPKSIGDPSQAKQFSEGQLIFRTAQFASATLDIATDVSSGFTPVMLQGQTGGGWGQFPWGLQPWGGVRSPLTLRFYVPQDKQYAGILTPRLTIRSGFADWILEGGSLQVFDVGPELGGPGDSSV